MKEELRITVENMKFQKFFLLLSTLFKGLLLRYPIAQYFFMQIFASKSSSLIPDILLLFILVVIVISEDISVTILLPIFWHPILIYSCQLLILWVYMWKYCTERNKTILNKSLC